MARSAAMSEPLARSHAQFPPLVRPEFFIGAASPLWAYFTGAAMTGAAWWWMTHWMRPASVEAIARAAMAAPALAMAEAAQLESMVEAAVEPALEAIVEAAGGPVAEALVSDAAPTLPVGGEAAPFGAAVLEAELLSDPGLAAELAQEETPAPRRAPPRSRKTPDGEPKPH
jgi:hypothetical protein